MVIIQPIHVKQAWPIRHRLMTPEKDRQSSLPKDELGDHFGLFENDELVSVGSIYRDGALAQFRKFATVEEKQRQGYGTQLLSHVIDYCKTQGIKKVWLNAKEKDLHFYQTLGFTTTDTTFKKDEINFFVVEREI
ncbi:GNAT family N-acetyltransferase [Pedobacter sp. HMF7647]|uniref:GNAT family N-acetyltransferase n=1 Tax=Hufsiella arboris TaxID=2695275 RepID=A0A7K1YE94_9SPHI|nr:GNAT family N-acetyltransferase [Hufsiella arboris]MXV52730.1 GNAT family N-acetyltransferase [Hufsiella arboris]